MQLKLVGTGQRWLCLLWIGGRPLKLAYSVSAASQIAAVQPRLGRTTAACPLPPLVPRSPEGQLCGELLPLADLSLSYMSCPIQPKANLPGFESPPPSQTS